MVSSANSGILHEDLPMLGFIPGTCVLVTKYNDLSVTMGLRGMDPECLPEEEIEARCERFLDAVRYLGYDFRITHTMISSPASLMTLETEYPNEAVQDLARRTAAHLSGKKLFQKHLYATFTLKASRLSAFVSDFSAKNLAKKLAGEESKRAQQLLTRVQALQQQLWGGLPMVWLSREETKQFYAQLVRFRPYNRAQRVGPDTNLDYWIPNSQPSIYPDHVWNDGHYLKAVTMRETPRIEGEILDGDKPRKVHGTHAAVFSGLLGLDGSFIASLDWNPQNPKQTKGKISKTHKWFDNRIVSFLQQMFASKNDARSDMRQNTANVKNRDELGYALAALDSGNFFGELSCSVIIYDETLEQAQAAIPKVQTALKGATVLQEDQSVYDVWLSVLPGNYRKNVRSLLCPVEAYKDMALVWTDDTGARECQVTPDRKPLFPLVTLHGSLYGYEPNDKSVPGVLIYGQQGGGKTFLANKHLDHFQRLAVEIDGQWVRPKTFVMDMKDSYKSNTLHHGGVYRSLSLDDTHGFRRNPFVLPVSKNSVEQITRLIGLMLTADNGPALGPEDMDNIRQEVTALYTVKERRGLRHARLGQLDLGAKLQGRLQPWVQGGPYASFFDNAEDEFENADWLTCQYSGFQKHQSVLLPLLYWDFEWFDAKVNNPALTRVPKFFVADELHVLLMANPLIGDYVIEKINTGRSFNLWCMFLMQWAALLEGTGKMGILNSACPVKLFTASENVRAADYAQIFEMPLKVAEQIKRLQKKQVLRYTATSAKVLSVDVDPQSIALYSNDVESNARRYEQAARELVTV
ncbi:MAG: VirB4 family type IV secretion system protein [Bryobacteraceae bacterium]